MDESTKWFYEQKAKATLEALRGNRMSGAYLPGAADVPAHVLGMIPQGAVVAMGGSMTVAQTGLLEALRQAPGLELLDRYAEGLSDVQRADMARRGLTADVFISGVNAVTEAGELLFVDAYGNRVAPILFGPKKVILVTGCNKVCADLETAWHRVRYYTAPANAHRLGRKTPCAKTGRCDDCASPDRICNETAIIHKQADDQRLHVVLVGEDLGL